MNVKEWRDAHRMTQAQLARLLEVDQITISRWERGVRKRQAPGNLLQRALRDLERELAEKGQETGR